MRKEFATLIVVLVIVLAFGSGFSSAAFTRNTMATVTKTLTLVSTASSSGIQIATSSSVSATCIIPDESELIVRVLNSSNGEPIGALPIQVENLYPICPPNPHTIENLGTMNTNASGIIMLSGLGEDYLTINYFGRFSVNASLGPEGITCVMLGIPSGDVDISYSQPFETGCK
jgi:hypothetical protein